MNHLLSFFFLLLIVFSCNTQAEDEDWVYTTRPGDTLWNISVDYLKSANDWKKLQHYNEIKNPKLLPPGSRLLIPVNWLKKQPTPAIIVAISGTAYVRFHQDKVLTPLKVGMKIPILSEITTENAAAAVVSFADDSRLIIQQNANVNFDTLSAHDANGMVDTRIRLQRGRVETHVVPFKNKKSRFEITTPAAVASVRGTKFRVDMNSDSAIMYTGVIKGEIEVASQGVSQIIPKGFGTKVEKGKPPLPPQPLLSAVDLSDLPTVFTTLSLKLSWPNVPGATSYHIEISPNREFLKTVFDENTPTSAINWRASEIGAYSLRIRAINEAGIEGLDATHHFSIIKGYPSPELVSPENNELIEKIEYTFQWRGHSDVTRFLLQVSPTSNFDETVIEANGFQQHYSTKTMLTPGSYYWRVANEYENGIIGNYSDTYQFQIKPNP